LRGAGRRPEAVRLTEVESPSDVPRFVEPLFLKLNADGRFPIVMSSDDPGEGGARGVRQAVGVAAGSPRA
jgi:hypothetical protein